MTFEDVTHVFDTDIWFLSTSPSLKQNSSYGYEGGHLIFSPSHVVLNFSMKFKKADPWLILLTVKSLSYRPSACSNCAINFNLMAICTV